MGNGLQERSMGRMIYQWLVGTITFIGLTLIIVSFFLSEEVKDVLRGIGLSLFPTGLIAFLITYFVNKITEILVTKEMKKSFDEALRGAGQNIKSTIDDIRKELVDSLANNTDLIKSNIDDVRKELVDSLANNMDLIKSNIQDDLVRLRKELEEFSPLFVSCSRLGLEDLYLTRSEALAHFASSLYAEIQKATISERFSGDSISEMKYGEIQKATRFEQPRVWFVSSSIKGFLEAASSGFDGINVLEQIVESNCDLRILMTELDTANIRAQQEGRGKGDIPDEIKMNLRHLKRIGVRRECIKFYPGAPTVFAIATTDKMILNPYPYQTEAFRCFTLIVRKTEVNARDIFNQYLRFHFEEPWQHAAEVPPEMWETLA
jgi:hypothetical protein